MDPRALIMWMCLLGCLKNAQCLEDDYTSKELYQEEPERYSDSLLEALQDGADHSLRPQSEERILNNLVRSLLHSYQRPVRKPSFLFQPQRFGRDARDGPAIEGIQARGSKIYGSMAAPQRFG